MGLTSRAERNLGVAKKGGVTAQAPGAAQLARIKAPDATARRTRNGDARFTAERSRRFADAAKSFNQSVKRVYSAKIQKNSGGCGLEVCDTAGWKSALPGLKAAP